MCDRNIMFANRTPNIASLAFPFGENDIAFLPYGPQWHLLRKIFVCEMLSNEDLNAFYTHRRVLKMRIARLSCPCMLAKWPLPAEESFTEYDNLFP